MSLERERLLLTLSLEFSAARETLSAMDALARYLSARFKPKKLTRNDIDPSAPPSGEQMFFSSEERTFFFRVPLSIPVMFLLEHPQSDPPTPEESEVLKKICLFFNERMEQISELRGLTYTDDLTGLYNQRYLELILDRELSLSLRNQTEFSVLFLDLDHFKNVNDTHGHLIGSRLLFEVGQEVKRTLRPSDITFRYGGDEFVVILSHTGLDDAIFVAERIRQQIEKKRFLVKDGLVIRLTTSIGVANVPLHAKTKQQILKAADEALYGVKKAVRNSVIAATIKAEG